MAVYDAGVLGLGAMGSFACLELARRGASVIGIDQFAPPHDRGSHSGDTRVFRTAYAEHPDYVPLAVRSGMLWDELGRQAGKALLTRCGMLSMGPPSSGLIAGIRRSSALHKLRIERLAAPEIRKRYPAFLPPENWVGLFGPAAGWVDVNAALGYALEQSRAAGSELLLDTPVLRWEARGADFTVHCPDRTLTVRKLVLAAGAWAGQLLAGLGLPLKILRKALVWVEPSRPEHFAPGRLPVFAFAREFFYGFPAAKKGVKLAIHEGGGRAVPDLGSPAPPPDTEDVGDVLALASRLLDGLGTRITQAKTCLYTMTPDEHFILDRHPQLENLSFGAGFSGHGFKFAPVIGEILADLALEGRTNLPAGFLSLKGRFGATVA